MTHNDLLCVGTGTGAAGIFAVVSIGLTAETVFYAAIGSITAFLVNELLKYIKRKLKK